MKPIPDTERPPWFQPWVPGWKRKLALPVYKFWTYDVLPPWDPGEPDAHGNVCCGRIILWGDAGHRLPSRRTCQRIKATKRAIAAPETSNAERSEWRARLRQMYRRNYHPREPIPRESWENVCETDIVYLPLFAGVDDPKQPPIGRGDGFRDRLPAEVHDTNLEALDEIAPRAKAVLTGNLYSEMAWAAYESPTARCDFEWWQTELRMRKFMEAASELVREAGGRPAFAMVPIEIEQDAYEGRYRMRSFFQEFDALLISFQADEIVTGFHQSAVQMDPDGWKQKYPYCQLLDYFGPVECIGGCNWESGILEHDWDQILADHGVKAIC